MFQVANIHRIESGSVDINWLTAATFSTNHVVDYNLQLYQNTSDHGVAEWIRDKLNIQSVFDKQSNIF